MKIESGRGIGAASTAKKGGATSAAPGFAPTVEGAQRTASTSGVSAVTPLDAILALQSDEPPAQRRARQAKRGRDALDALEQLEHGLLTGQAPAALKAELESLHCAAQPTGDARLDDILNEIDIRLAVEAAKLERLPGRA
jgi:Class II flagellar assembly regulator